MEGTKARLSLDSAEGIQPVLIQIRANPPMLRRVRGTVNLAR
jgi:hypothetical protein